MTSHLRPEIAPLIATLRQRLTKPSNNRSLTVSKAHIETLLAEIEELSEARYKLTELGLHELHAAGDGIHLTASAPQWFMALLVAASRELLDGLNGESGGVRAKNYVEQSVEFTVTDPEKAPDVRRYVVTIRRAEGKTPHQKRLEAEAVLRDMAVYVRQTYGNGRSINVDKLCDRADAVLGESGGAHEA